MSVKFKETIQEQTSNAASDFMKGAQNGNGKGKSRGGKESLAHEAGEFLTRGGGAKGYLQVCVGHSLHSRCSTALF